MDPSTTLVAFHFQTHPSVQSVQLIGSWDNFSQSYPMQRDVRRGRGQWRGCHTFRDIICDDAPGPGTPYKRHGGLKMGHTYYYYYEVDGSLETHNPSLPSTTSCPYMPGQSVNTMIVPVEQALRQRSASLTSMRQTDFKTMDPDFKFTTPRPILSPENTTARLGTSPMLHHKHSTGSLNTTPAWKRFFTRKLNSRDGDRGRPPAREGMTFEEFGSRCTTPSEGTRTRDISPESLRRFLSDDIPSRPGSNLSVRPTLVIPEDIPEDEDSEVEGEVSNTNDNDNDDDDNFATSAVSETQTYATRLSPPPCRRTASCESMNAAAKSSSSATLKPPKHLPVCESREVPASAVIPSRPRLETLSGPRNFTAPSYFVSPVSSQYPDDEAQAYCYDLTDDEDDLISSNNSDILCGQPAASITVESYECYSLPEPEDKGRKTVEPQSNYTKINGSPSIGSDMAVSAPNLLDTPINHGLDDFVSELGWMADIIGGKRF